ncbi:hypothetical protein C2G38_2173898, partial [Gigaspora rosea]
MEEYNTAKKEYQILIDYQSQYFSFINSVKAIAQHGFTIDALSLTTQIQCQIDINMNLMKTKKEIIDKYEQQIREFSLCLLISNDKKVYLSKQYNPIKDYFDYLQSTGGFKEKNETFED